MSIRTWSVTLRVLLVAVATLLAAGLLVLAGNQFLALRARLAQEPASLAWLLGAAGVAVVAMVGIGLYRLLFPPAAPTPAQRRPRDESSLREEIAHWRRQGVDTATAERELAELERRRAGGRVVAAVHGEMSAGKSSLIHALLPQEQISTDVIGGTTRAVTRYTWRAPDGTEVELADMPGLGGEDQGHDRAAVDEAARAHLVLFVTDGDLNRGQWRAVQALAALDKPLVVAINKSDRLAADDLAAVTEHLRRWCR